jgi:hypothetical protein
MRLPHPCGERGQSTPTAALAEYLVAAPSREGEEPGREGQEGLLQTCRVIVALVATHAGGPPLGLRGSQPGEGVQLAPTRGDIGTSWFRKTVEGLPQRLQLRGIGAALRMKPYLTVLATTGLAPHRSGRVDGRYPAAKTAGLRPHQSRLLEIRRGDGRIGARRKQNGGEDGQWSGRAGHSWIRPTSRNSAAKPRPRATREVFVPRDSWLGGAMRASIMQSWRR